MNQYDPMPTKIRAIRDHIIITEMNFGEIKTSAGIILRSDDGKSHGVHPRWGKIYCIGPEQKEFKPGQWILVEHGRWTRGLKINDGDGVKTVQRVDTEAILAVSDEPPSDADFIVGNSI